MARRAGEVGSAQQLGLVRVGGRRHMSNCVLVPVGCSAGKRPGLFERSEFPGRPERILRALDAVACGADRLPAQGRVQ
jgi:hypothetical protein